MFGLSGEKLLIIAVIAFFVLGPERLPIYAKKLAEFVKSARRFADNAKVQLKDELGEDFQDVDWRKLDPRQYDPRRIIREALLDEDPIRESDLTKLASPAASTLAAGAASKSVSKRLEKGEPAPFDSEST